MEDVINPLPHRDAFFNALTVNRTDQDQTALVRAA